MSKRYTEEDINEEVTAQVRDEIMERVSDNIEGRKIEAEIIEHIKNHPDEETEYEYQSEV